MVKDTQNKLYNFVISFSKERKTSTQVNRSDAPWKRKPLQGTLAFEWFLLYRNALLIRFYYEKTRFTPIDFYCNVNYQNFDFTF